MTTNYQRRHYSELRTTRSRWPQRLAGAAALVLMLAVLVNGMMLTAEDEEYQAAAISTAAEAAAFEAGRLAARDEMQGHVTDAYEQGRRDGLQAKAGRP